MGLLCQMWSQSPATTSVLTACNLQNCYIAACLACCKIPAPSPGKLHSTRTPPPQAQEIACSRGSDLRGQEMKLVAWDLP
eukprot:3559786-Amphidinium_carterae.2